MGQTYQVGVDYTISGDSITILPGGAISSPSRIYVAYSANAEQPASDNQITTEGDTTLVLLDIPLINDTDNERGIYLTGSGGQYWREASIYVSLDGGSSYDLATILDSPGTHGICDTALTELGDTVDVTLTEGELESVTIANLDAGNNKALLGDEIIQFETASLVSGTTYTLTNLRRGLRGTEQAQTSHSIGERFILLTGSDAYLERLTNSTITTGQTLYFKALTSGQSLDQVTASTLTYQGNDLKPYAPVNLGATKDEAGNITLNWTRRDRRAGERTDYANFPLSEVSESYEVEILNGGAVVRTIATSTPTAKYLATEQVNDFGSTQTTLEFRVYQLSGTVGRGNYAQSIVTPTLSSAVPEIASFSPIQGKEGSVVTATGFGFTGVTEVRVNGTICIFAINSDTEIQFTIAAAVTTGFVEIEAPGGTATSTIPFTIGGVEGHIIQDDSGSYTARANLKFIGNVNVTDDATNDATIVEVTGGSGGATASGEFGEVTATTASLNQGDSENLDLDMAAISSIREITLSHPGRLRLFGTDSDRASDTADVNTELDIDEAIDLEFSTNLSRRFVRGILVQNLEDPLTNTIYGKLFNNSGISNSLNLDIKYYALASIAGAGNVDLNTGLIAYWKLDESSGIRIDSVGGYNCTEVGGAIGSRAGILNEQLNLVASQGRYLELANTPSTSFNTDQNFSVSLWATIDDKLSRAFFISLYQFSNSDERKWVLFYEQNQDAFSTVISANGLYSPDNQTFSTTHPATGTPYHLLTSYDLATNQSKLYVNGILEDYLVGENALYTPPTQNLMIGNYNTGTEHFNGAIDEIAYWNRALNQAEVTAIYNNGLGLPLEDF